MDFKVIVAIPARLESSRLPNKVLADICGKPMIVHVLERCSNSKLVDNVVLCTDNKKLSILSNRLGYLSFMTDKNCSSGTERIASVVSDLIKLAWKLESNVSKKTINKFARQTLIINVQGDQPLLNFETINEIVSLFKLSNFNSEIITPVYKLDKKDIHNPSVVKTIFTSKGKILYFSRAAIPYIRDVPQKEWHKHYEYWGHIGMYGFRADILINWTKLESSKLEDMEKLEQLRFLEAGYDILSFISNEPSISVDTKDQLNQVRLLMKDF